MKTSRWVFEHPASADDGEVFASVTSFPTLQSAIDSLDSLWHAHIGSNTVVLFLLEGTSIFYRMYAGNWVYTRADEVDDIVIGWNAGERT